MDLWSLLARLAVTGGRLANLVPMIGCAREYRRRPVKLLRQHHPRQHVRPNHRSETQQPVSPRPQLIIVPVGPADQKGETIPLRTIQ